VRPDTTAQGDCGAYALKQSRCRGAHPRHLTVRDNGRESPVEVEGNEHAVPRESFHLAQVA
jgi:hypothetical protein